MNRHCDKLSDEAARALADEADLPPLSTSPRIARRVERRRNLSGSESRISAVWLAVVCLGDSQTRQG